VDIEKIMEQRAHESNERDDSSLLDSKFPVKEKNLNENWMKPRLDFEFLDYQELFRIICE